MAKQTKAELAQEERITWGRMVVRCLGVILANLRERAARPDTPADPTKPNSLPKAPPWRATMGCMMRTWGLSREVVGAAVKAGMDRGLLAGFVSERDSTDGGCYYTKPYGWDHAKDENRVLMTWAALPELASEHYKKRTVKRVDRELVDRELADMAMGLPDGFDLEQLAAELGLDRRPESKPAGEAVVRE